VKDSHLLAADVDGSQSCASCEKSCRARAATSLGVMGATLPLEAQLALLQWAFPQPDCSWWKYRWIRLRTAERFISGVARPPADPAADPDALLERKGSLECHNSSRTSHSPGNTWQMLLLLAAAASAHLR